MNRAHLFLLLAILGALVPVAFFVGFFQAEGLGADFVGAAFVNGAAGGLTADLVISSAVFWLFLFPEARRRGIRHTWIYVLLNLLIGLSCALPLFLWAREKAAA